MSDPIDPRKLLEQLPSEFARFKYARAHRAERERLRVLVVEDQLFSRKLLFEVLRNTYEVDLAGTAFEGLKLYLEEAPDIAFLDIELEGESGHVLGRIIRELDPDAYLVMVTGNQSAMDVAHARNNKVAAYIVKPYSKQKIFDAIATYKEAKGPKTEEGAPDEPTRQS